MTDTETIALLSQIIAETAEELGCENDNEAILQAIHDLKQRASLPSPPVLGEAVSLDRLKEIIQKDFYAAPMGGCTERLAKAIQDELCLSASIIGEKG